LQNRIFRKVSLERLSSPERLDELMQLTTPGGWLALFALCAIIVLAIAWGLFGRIPTVVSAQGILIRDGSIQTVESTSSGQVSEVLVGVGDTVRQDQVVARVVLPESGRAVEVKSTYDGRVLEVRVNRGNVIQAGTSLLALELEGRPLEAILYLPPIDGKKVQPGMDVQIAPASVRREQYGLMRGRVAAVGELPATLQSMGRVLGSDELARTLSAGGAPIQVEVELIPDEATASGFRWTSPSGPPITIQNGTPCAADIVLAEQAPISLLFAGAAR
jgi:multidrug efflux pump subunit AcrA (membrane-fusion protein)